jgi:hypothetical protein
MGFSEAELLQLRENQRRANPERAVPARETPAAIARSEAELERDCTNILIHDGWRALKTNPVSRRAHGKGFGERGMADYLYIRYLHHAKIEFYTCHGTRVTTVLKHPASEVMWIEWKRRTETGTDTKAAEHQKDWHRDERCCGALTLIAGEDFPATVDGFAAWYEASGLKRDSQAMGKI